MFFFKKMANDKKHNTMEAVRTESKKCEVMHIFYCILFW